MITRKHPHARDLLRKYRKSPGTSPRGTHARFLDYCCRLIRAETQLASDSWYHVALKSWRILMGRLAQERKDTFRRLP